MGVLNVTPDSFSEGVRFADPDSAFASGHAMIAEGADVIDVGGESTRPGASDVAQIEEWRRVGPVVEALARHVRVSIDTRKPAVAEAALAAGATLLNDVSASLHEIAAAAGAGWVAMHMQGQPATMQLEPGYADVVGDVRSFLMRRGEAARAAGVEEVWIDPGIGFGKTVTHNLSLLRHLDDLVVTGFPVVVGTSRKQFLGRLLAASDAGDSEVGLAATPPDDRLEGSVATVAWAARHGAAMVRVHDVRAAVHAVKVVAG
ncbi:dihydropteroate synthase [soil metagenome]